MATSFPTVQASPLPAPGSMVLPTSAFVPVVMKGLKVDPHNPFQFDFIIDTGDQGTVTNFDKEKPELGFPTKSVTVPGFNQEQLKQQSNLLIKYFLTALTIPEKDLWVNLSPYEKDRMIPTALGQTQMGRDMLAQDYILKQLTASLIYPEKDLGKTFWDRVYKKAQEQYGTTEIPVNTFNKVWIVADRADVFEKGSAAYIVGAHLKVMLEEDYLAIEKNQRQPGDMFNNKVTKNVSPSTLPSKKGANAKASQVNHQTTNDIIKELIIPEIEKEVNQGKNFAPLRQMFYSMILASWYKTALKNALITQMYGNQNKIQGLGLQTRGHVQERTKENVSLSRLEARAGLNTKAPQGNNLTPNEIYQQYLQAYKKGVFNYIKDDFPPLDGEGKGEVAVPRKYFSGGLQIGTDIALNRGAAMTTEELSNPRLIQVSGPMVIQDSSAAMKTFDADKELTNIVSALRGRIINFRAQDAMIMPRAFMDWLMEYASTNDKVDHNADMPVRFLRGTAEISGFVDELNRARVSDEPIKVNYIDGKELARKITPEQAKEYSIAVRIQYKDLSYNVIVYHDPEDILSRVIRANLENKTITEPSPTQPEGLVLLLELPLSERLKEYASDDFPGDFLTELSKGVPNAEIITTEYGVFLGVSSETTNIKLSQVIDEVWAWLPNAAMTSQVFLDSSGRTWQQAKEQKPVLDKEVIGPWGRATLKDIMKHAAKPDLEFFHLTPEQTLRLQEIEKFSNIELEKSWEEVRGSPLRDHSLQRYLSDLFFDPGMHNTCYYYSFVLYNMYREDIDKGKKIDETYLRVEKKMLLAIEAMRRWARGASVWNPKQETFEPDMEQQAILNELGLVWRDGKIYYGPSFKPLKLRSKIIFSRHADTDLIAKTHEDGFLRYQGDVDDEALNRLSLVGLKQAEEFSDKLSILLKGDAEAMYFTSPLTRVIQTWTPAQKKLKFKVQPYRQALREISFGLFENKTDEEIRQMYGEAALKVSEAYRRHNAAVRNGGGEDIIRFLKRIKDEAIEIDNLLNGKTGVVFAHGTVGSALMILFGQLEQGQSIEWRNKIPPTATPMVLYDPKSAAMNSVRNGKVRAALKSASRSKAGRAQEALDAIGERDEAMTSHKYTIQIKKDDANKTIGLQAKIEQDPTYTVEAIIDAVGFLPNQINFKNQLNQGRVVVSLDSFKTLHRTNDIADITAGIEIHFFHDLVISVSLAPDQGALKITINDPNDVILDQVNIIENVAEQIGTNMDAGEKIRNRMAQISNAYIRFKNEAQENKFYGNYELFADMIHPLTDISVLPYWLGKYSYQPSSVLYIDIEDRLDKFKVFIDGFSDDSPKFLESLRTQAKVFIGNAEISKDVFLRTSFKDPSLNPQEVMRRLQQEGLLKVSEEDRDNSEDPIYHLTQGIKVIEERNLFGEDTQAVFNTLRRFLCISAGRESQLGGLMIFIDVGYFTKKVANSFARVKRIVDNQYNILMELRDALAREKGFDLEMINTESRKTVVATQKDPQLPSLVLDAQTHHFVASSEIPIPYFKELRDFIIQRNSNVRIQKMTNFDLEQTFKQLTDDSEVWMSILYEHNNMGALERKWKEDQRPFLQRLVDVLARKDFEDIRNKVQGKLGEPGLDILREVLVRCGVPASAAMNAPTPGGIDLNRNQMQMNIHKDNAGFPTKVFGNDNVISAAMIARIKSRGVDSIAFKIETMVPVTNLAGFLGINN